MSERPDKDTTWHVGKDFVSFREGQLNPHLPDDMLGSDFPENLIVLLDDKFAQVVGEWMVKRFGGFESWRYHSSGESANE